MKREILFRGKRGNDWLYGWLQKLGDKYYIFPEEAYDSADNYEVDPSTISQFTGLPDKNGKKVFEGDVITLTDPEGKMKQDDGRPFIETVQWRYGMWISSETNETWEEDSLERDQETWEYEVIGNIHDNPELI